MILGEYDYNTFYDLRLVAECVKESDGNVLIFFENLDLEYFESIRLQVKKKCWMEDPYGDLKFKGIKGKLIFYYNDIIWLRRDLFDEANKYQISCSFLSDSNRWRRDND